MGSNIRDLVNTYFPSKNTTYKDELTGLSMTREYDNRPYEDKKQELIGTICRQLNDGDGIVFTPDFGKHEYVVVYGSPQRSAHRWFLRTEGMLEHMAPATVDVSKKWKKTLADFNIVLEDKYLKELKLLEDIDSLACTKNETYLINDDEEYITKFFCLSDTNKVYTSGSLYDMNEIEDNVDRDELLKRLNKNIEEIYGVGELINIYSYIRDSMRIVYNNNRSYKLDSPELKNFNFNERKTVDSKTSRFLNSRIEYILDKIIKQYRKKVGNVIELAEVGVTLWQIK